MEGVGPGFCDVIDHGTGITAVLRTEVAADDLDFLQGILVRKEDLRACYGVVVVRLAMDFEVI